MILYGLPSFSCLICHFIRSAMEGHARSALLSSKRRVCAVGCRKMFHVEHWRFLDVGQYVANFYAVVSINVKWSVIPHHLSSNLTKSNLMLIRPDVIRCAPEMGVLYNDAHVERKNYLK